MIIWQIAAAAAQKRRDLSCEEGHVVLLEYVEEMPLLLGRPGAHMLHYASAVTSRSQETVLPAYSASNLQWVVHHLHGSLAHSCRYERAAEYLLPEAQRD